MKLFMKGFLFLSLLAYLRYFFRFFFGTLIGSLSAFYRGKWQDRGLIALSMLCISIPNFVFATLLQYIFSMKLQWLPLARYEGFSYMILPAFALAALPTASIARLIRSNMIEVLSQDYILMAKSKGIGPLQLVLHHVLKNSLLPALTYVGHLSASILTGSFVVEKIFAIPGLGHAFVSSIANRDYTLIMGITIFYSTFLMICICLVDILYLVIDPRVRRSYEK